jgi:hypothetical protein
VAVLVQTARRVFAHAAGAGWRAIPASVLPVARLGCTDPAELGRLLASGAGVADWELATIQHGARGGQRRGAAPPQQQQQQQRWRGPPIPPPPRSRMMPAGRLLPRTHTIHHTARPVARAQS